MNPLSSATVNFLHDEEGVTAIEYALIAALIAVAIIAIVTLIGNQINSVFMQICTALKGTGGVACTP